MSNYLRARPSGTWRDLPDTSTPILATHVEKWEDAIYDVKTILANSAANVVSTTYGTALAVGNVSTSFGFAGAGTPAEAYSPFVVYQKWGDYLHNTNAPITKTTQTAFFIGSYHGPATDDGACGVFSQVALKDTGTPFTQTKGVTSGEFDIRIEGANQVTTAPAAAVGARITVNDTSHVDHAVFYEMSHAGQTGSGTYTNVSGLWQASAFTGSGVNRAVDAIDDISTQSAFVLGQSGDNGKFQAEWGGTGSAFVYVQIPDGTDMATMRLQGTSGQAHALAEFWKAGAGSVSSIVSSAGGFITFNSAGFLAQTGGGANVAGMNQDGIFTSKNAAPVDANVANGQAFFWLDATPGATKLMVKAKDSGGTVRTGSLALT